METLIPRDELDYAQVEAQLGVSFFDDPARTAVAASIHTPEARALAAEHPARARIFRDVIAAETG